MANYGCLSAGYLVSGFPQSIPLVLRTHGVDIQKDQKLNYGLRLNADVEKKNYNNIK